MKISPDLTGMTSKINAQIGRESFLMANQLSSRVILIFFLVSIVLHAALFAGFLFFPELKRNKSMPPVIQIDLVSFAPVPTLEDTGVDETPPPPEIDQKPEEGIAVKPKSIVTKKKEIGHKKPDISLKTKPKNLKKLLAEKKKKPARKKEPEKKKDPKPAEPEEKKADSEAKIADAKKELEKKAASDEEARIAEALRRMEQKVAVQKESRNKEGAGNSPGQGKKGYKPIDLYHLVIESSIRQSWVFNDTLARMDKNLEVVVLIKILQSGEIRDFIYETRSGNKHLDESAKKAIMKINPLPPLPAGMRSYDLGLIFTPKGLK